MYTRREVLGKTAVGAGIGAGILATSSTASAAGASFGDGVNLQPSYFCSGDQDLGWDLMNQYPDIQTVRIEIEPFSFNETAHTRDDGKRWIDEAYANGKHVIATYHHYPDNGSTDPAAVQNAADFWVEHYDYLTQDAQITINLMNEWGNHDVTVSQYADTYNQAISTIRSGTSYTGPIICDAPGWGQQTYVLADASQQIDDDNLILSAHVYGDGWNGSVNENLQPYHLDVMDQTGYPCMIGEFGTERDGSVDVDAMITYAKELGWPVIGWAWNGDGDFDMNMADPYWGDDCNTTSYTEAWYFENIYQYLGSGDGGDGGDGLPTVGDSQGPPNDLDGDGTYMDVNGNDRLDNDDVVTYFNHMDDPAIADNVAAFDYNANGRIDFDDVVTLFESL